MLDTEKSVSSISLLSDKLYRDTIFIKGLFYIIFVAVAITVFELIFFTEFIIPQQTHEIENFINSLSKDYKKYILKNMYTYEIYGSDPMIKQIYDDITKNYNKDTEMYILVAIERETRLINKINSDAVSFIIIEIMILVCAMILIYRYLKYVIKFNYFNYTGSQKLSETKSEERIEDRTDLEELKIIQSPGPTPVPTPGLELELVQNDAQNDIHNNYNKSTFSMGDITPVVVSAFMTLGVLAFFQIFMYNFAQKFKYTGMNGTEEILFLIQNKLRSDITS